MKNYQCKFGLYHDKPVNNGEPSSNNGWIYTSYAMKLHIVYDISNIEICFELCQTSASKDRIYHSYRLPGKIHPPISRDEIIGMVSLGFDPLLHKWFMYRHTSVGRVYFKAAVALWKIRKEHRNHLWENRILDAYPLAFKLMWHDRYYINKMQNKHASLFQWLMFHIYVISTIIQLHISNAVSPANVCLLQLEDLGSRFWIKFFNKKKQYAEYFSEDHIFNEVLSE